MAPLISKIVVPLQQDKSEFIVPIAMKQFQFSDNK
jgi:hypothetical protein